MANQLNNFVLNIIKQVAQNNWWQRYLEYVYHLNSNQVLLIAVIAVILITIILYHRFGSGAVAGFLILVFLIYILYTSKIFENWQKDSQEEQRRMQIYQVEMQKK
jgi:hypothetical protein